MQDRKYQCPGRTGTRAASFGPASNRRDENAQNEVLDAPAERAAPVA